MSILLSIPITLAALYYEEFFLRSQYKSLYTSASDSPLMVPKFGGLIILVNIVLSGLLLTYLGFRVGSARKRFIAKATKDGEEKAEERFSYPNMYAEGNTTNAKLFNCIQRGHQQALETYTQFIALSLASGLRFPIVTALSGLLWCFARLKWADGYASGEPSQRYEHWASKGIWVSLISLLLGSIATSLKIMGVW